MKKSIAALVWVFFLVASPLKANPLYPLDSPKQEAQFTHLLKNLRCLVCQNQDLADSNAGLAQDLKSMVHSMVKANQSDEAIIEYLTTRYGDFILFKPPVKPLTYLLWFGPAIFLAIGLLVFWQSSLRGKQNA